MKMVERLGNKKAHLGAFLLRHHRYPRQPLAGAVGKSSKGMYAQDVGGKEAGEIAVEGVVSANVFTWYVVSCAVGKVKNQGPAMVKLFQWNNISSY